MGLHNTINNSYLSGEEGFLHARENAVKLFLAGATEFRKFRFEREAVMLESSMNILLHASMVSLTDRPNKYTVMGSIKRLGKALNMEVMDELQQSVLDMTKEAETEVAATLKTAYALTKGAAALGKAVPLFYQSPSTVSAAPAGTSVYPGYFESPLPGGFTAGTIQAGCQSVVSGGIVAQSAVIPRLVSPAVISGPGPLIVSQPEKPQQTAAEKQLSWEKRMTNSLYTWGKNKGVTGCVSCAYLHLRETSGGQRHEMRDCPQLKKALEAFSADLRRRK